MADEDSLPKTVQVEGLGEVPFDELVKTYRNRSDFERANHQRAAEIKQMREQTQREIDEMRRAAQAERTQFLETLKGFAPQSKPAEEVQFDPQAAVAQVDFLDPEAPKKLGEAIAVGLASERQRLERTLEQRLAAAEQGFQSKLQEAQKTSQTQDARSRARAEAAAANERTFMQRMQTQHGDVLAQLKPQELEEVKDMYRSMVNKRMGKWVEGEWWFAPEAVDAAVRAAEPTHRLLLARESSKARLGTLQERQAGEAATSSTPLRGAARGTATPDELSSRADDIARGLRTGRYDYLDVDRTLPDDPAALRELIQKRRDAILNG